MITYLVHILGSGVQSLHYRNTCRSGISHRSLCSCTVRRVNRIGPMRSYLTQNKTNLKINITSSLHGIFSFFFRPTQNGIPFSLSFFNFSKPFLLHVWTKIFWQLTLILQYAIFEFKTYESNIIRDQLIIIPGYYASHTEIINTLLATFYFDTSFITSQRLVQITNDRNFCFVLLLIMFPISIIDRFLIYVLCKT